MRKHGTHLVDSCRLPEDAPCHVVCLCGERLDAPTPEDVAEEFQKHRTRGGDPRGNPKPTAGEEGSPWRKENHETATRRAEQLREASRRYYERKRGLVCQRARERYQAGQAA